MAACWKECKMTTGQMKCIFAFDDLADRLFCLHGWSDWQLAFILQLTSSWVKLFMRRWYGKIPVNREREMQINLWSFVIRTWMMDSSLDCEVLISSHQTLEFGSKSLRLKTQCIVLGILGPNPELGRNEIEIWNYEYLSTVFRRPRTHIWGTWTIFALSS